MVVFYNAFSIPSGISEVNLLPKPKFSCSLLKRPVLIGKERSFIQDASLPGEKVDSCLKTNFKVSAWPKDF